MRSNNCLVVCGALLLSAGSLHAQNAAPASCTRSEHQQFDFWVGEWNVFNAQGQQVGSNRISRVSNGCALLEEWRPAQGGGEGKSINFYDPADQRWHQVWVGGDGTVLRIAGSFQDGAMTLAGGARTTPRGTVQDRIVWTPRTDGTVEQRWEISTDNGASWQTGFLGVYRRK